MTAQQYRTKLSVPREMCQPALDLLIKTYGQHPPPPIQALITSLAKGIAATVENRRRRGHSKFDPLIDKKSMDFPTPTPADYSALRSAVHSWAHSGQTSKDPIS